MPTKFRKLEIGEVFHLISGFAFKGSDFSSKGVPVVKIKNIKAGHFHNDDFTYVCPRFLQERPEKVVEKHDLLISMTGNRHDGSPETWVGKVALFNEDGDYFINQRVGALRVKDRNTIDPVFGSYLLSSWYFQQWFISIATSSGGQANISPKQILESSITVPDIKYQRFVGGILATLDSKILLNTQLNQTLESMAQALFKSWFVDFDPVIDNAIAAGNPIPEPFQARAERRRQRLHEAPQDGQSPLQPLPAELRQLFPDAFQETEELGWVPEGWLTTEFSELARHIKRNVGAEEIQRNVMYIGLEHIDREKIFLSQYGVGADVSSNKSSFQKMDLLFGKLRPYFHKVVIAPEDGICSTDILVFRTKRKIYYSYMLMTAFSEQFVAAANSGSTGTRMPRASAIDLLSFRVPMPSTLVLAEFESQLEKYWVAGIGREAESKVLASLRDMLLPKLLSGQLRIPDAEAQLAEADA